MKRIGLSVLAVALLAFLLGCGLQNSIRDDGTNWGNKKPATSEQSLGPGGSYKVDFLFEVDGYKVYRFVDMAHARYLVLPTGDKRTAQVLGETSESSGKSTIYEDDSVTTVLN